MEIRAPFSSGWSPLPSNANVEITMVSVYPDSWEQREARSVHGNVGCRPMSQKVCSSHDWSSDLWIFGCPPHNQLARQLGMEGMLAGAVVLRQRSQETPRNFVQLWHQLCWSCHRHLIPQDGSARASKLPRLPSPRPLFALPAK